MKRNQSSQELVIKLAKQAGVSVDDAASVLKSLGLDGLIANIGAAGVDIDTVNLGELKVAARLGRGGLVV